MKDLSTDTKAHKAPYKTGTLAECPRLVGFWTFLQPLEIGTRVSFSRGIISEARSP